MNEHDFDQLLSSAVPELPPDDIVHEVTPWRKAIDRILIGMALCTITLNFLTLNYILPAMGMMFMLLGFRALRNENGWFKACWVLMLLRAFCYFPTIIFNATIYQSMVYNSAFGSALSHINPVLQFLLIFALWRAIATVQKKAGAPVHASSAAALLAWYTASLLLALAQYDGLILGIIMLVCYILIIRSLYHISGEMDEIGYTMKASHVSVSDRNLVKALVVLLTAGIVCGYLFFGSYHMAWLPKESMEGTEIAKVKNELLSLGYPEAALNDLSGEDILACRNALQIVSQEQNKPINDGRQLRETEEGYSTYIRTVYDVKELRFTNVAVELPGETPQWRIFHHFLWTVNPGFSGTESLQLWPAYWDSDGWAAAGSPTGRVLYDKNNAVYTAPFHSLATEGYTSDDLLFGQRYTTDIFATFSLPENGERQRGYLSYGIAQTKEGYIINAWANYTHQKSKFQYPVLTADETQKTSGWNDSYPFITVQNALQFFFTENGIELLGEDSP